MDSYDLVVVGAGSGGLTAARTAASFGVRVALLEKNKIGGDCLHTGCVPSKSLIHMARAVHELQNTRQFINLTIGALDYPAVYQAVHERISYIENDSDNPDALKQAGVGVIFGDFSFSDRRTLVSKAGQKIRFKKCIIATGSKPAVPAIKGMEAITYFNSDTIWDLTELPASLAIIGAGPIGLELGQAFRMLGSQVTLFERSDRLFSRMDEPVSLALQKSFSDSGIAVMYNSSVEEIEKTANGVKIHFKVAGKPASQSATHVLIATGRTPGTHGMGIEEIGVKLNDKNGIAVDRHLRSAQKHIYAIGDVLNGPLFTHWAAQQAAAAAIHALFGRGEAPSTELIPNVTFTTPEIGQVGKTASQLKEAGTYFRTISYDYGHIDKAVAENERGSITILVNKQDLVLGAIIIGAHAAELIGYFVLLIEGRRPVTALAGPIQAYPTMTIGLKQLTGEQQLQKYSKSWFIKTYLHLRGWKLTK